MGAKPLIFVCIFPKSPHQDFQVSLSTPGLFHFLDLFTQPFAPKVCLALRFCLCLGLAFGLTQTISEALVA